MATKNGEGRSQFYKTMLRAQFDAYLKVAVRKHKLAPDLLHTEPSTMSDVELEAAITVLRDLAHLPPE